MTWSWGSFLIGVGVGAVAALATFAVILALGQRSYNRQLAKHWRSQEHRKRIKPSHYCPNWHKSPRS